MRNPCHLSCQTMTSHSIAKNTLFIFFARFIPLLAALISIPYLIRYLGVEKMGLLSLVWVIIGYFSLFDIGLGRAVTQKVSELLGGDQEFRISKIFWNSLLLQFFMGLIGGLFLFFLIPLFDKPFVEYSGGAQK